ncbi:MAG TPA: hypothetical protein VFH51_15535 [Myxococcota bacterium]|nr:hypothetical protein [Myxococcota bacterium]
MKRLLPLYILGLVTTFDDAASQANLVDASRNPQANPQSWLDCQVSTSRYRQFCKVAERKEVVSVDLAVKTDDALIRLLTGQEASDAFTPRLKFWAQWADSSRCWALGPPAAELTVESHGGRVARLPLGQAERSLPLREDGGGRPLWTYQPTATGARLVTTFSLKDPSPAPYPEGRSPRPYPLECDITVANLRMEYEPLLLRDEGRHVEEQAEVLAEMMQVERTLHGFYVERDERRLHYIAQVAAEARKRDAPAGQPPPPWQTLSEPAQGIIVVLLHAAASEGLLPPFEDDADAWDYFVAEFVPENDRLFEHPLELSKADPAPGAFLRRGRIVHHTGWSNAQSFLNHAAQLAALTQRSEALRQLMQGSQP